MRKMLLRLTALLLAAFTFTHSFAQQKITGTVTNDKQTPLSGATVTVKGTRTVTTTDATGNTSWLYNNGAQYPLLYDPLYNRKPAYASFLQALKGQ